MGTSKEDCLAIAGALAAAHTAHPNSPELDTLHHALDNGLENQFDLLELTDEDVDEIRGVTLAARGGEPKPNPK